MTESFKLSGKSRDKHFRRCSSMLERANLRRCRPQHRENSDIRDQQVSTGQDNREPEAEGVGEAASTSAGLSAQSAKRWWRCSAAEPRSAGEQQRRYRPVVAGGGLRLREAGVVGVGTDPAAALEARARSPRKLLECYRRPQEQLLPQNIALRYGI